MTDRPATAGPLGAVPLNDAAARVAEIGARMAVDDAAAEAWRDAALLTLFPSSGGCEMRLMGRRVRVNVEWLDSPPHPALLRALDGMVEAAHGRAVAAGHLAPETTPAKPSEGVLRRQGVRPAYVIRDEVMHVPTLHERLLADIPQAVIDDEPPIALPPLTDREPRGEWAHDPATSAIGRTTTCLAEWCAWHGETVLTPHEHSVIRRREP